MSSPQNCAFSNVCFFGKTTIGIGLIALSLATRHARGADETPPIARLQLQYLSASDRVKINGWIQAGYNVNPDDPPFSRNFGHILDDRANGFLLHQIGLQFERQLMPKPGEWDWGFFVRGFYGSDARFTHALGFGDHYGDDLYQADLFDCTLLLHVPILTQGGVDFRIGKGYSLIGQEAVDPRLNFFYSHSYTAYFANLATDTGVFSTVHLVPHVDLYAGISRGANVAFTDNNHSASFQGGLGLVGVLNGKMDSFLITHIGPETPHNNRDLRYYYDWNTTFRINDKWKALTNVFYNVDEATGAMCYGGLLQFAFQVHEQVALGLRGEIFRDEDGQYVLQLGNNTDLMSILRGEPPTSPQTFTGGKTTYGTFTAGINYKPKLPYLDCTFRPEIRYDCALNNTRPYNNATHNNQWTLGIDVVIAF